MNYSVSRPDINTQDKSPLTRNRLRPDIKAALVVAIFFIGFEIFGDLIPFLGYLITFPLTLIVYYIQGLLTGIFIQRDPKYRSINSWGYARLGFSSGLCTGLILALILSILSYIVTTPATLGFSLAELPFTLVTILLDLVTNLMITTLIAWLFGAFSRSAFMSISCFLLIFSLGSACIADILLGIGISKILVNILPHLRTYIPFFQH